MRSVLHPRRRLPYALALLAVLLATPVQPGFAISTGIAGYSGKQQGVTCNVCHSLGSTPNVSLTGPQALNPSEVGTYTFTVKSTSSHQTAAGFNVAASGGTLRVVNGQKERLLSTELTHTGPKANDADAQAMWEFEWKAPATAGNYTLFAAGNSVNLNGSTGGDAAATTLLSVAVGSVVTPTPTSTLTPSPTRTAPPTASPTQTPVPSDTPTPEPTETLPPSPTFTPTATPAPTDTPPDTPTATSTPFPTAIPTPGDANCDGTVSAADVPSLVALLEGVAPLVCGGVDANQNGMLDEDDVPVTIDSIFQEGVVP